MRSRTVVPMLVLLSAWVLRVPVASAASGDRGGVADYYILEGVPESGYLTIMSRWIDSDHYPSAVVFSVNESGDVLEIADKKGNRAMWQGLIERFYRSEHAYDMLSRMIERMPVVFGDRPVSEQDVFSYLPYLYSRVKKQAFAHARLDYGTLPGFCPLHSRQWRDRLGERLVVTDRHDQAGNVREGHVLVFSEGADARQRHLKQVLRLVGDESAPVWSSASEATASLSE